MDYFALHNVHFFCFNIIERKVPLNIFVRSALKVPEDTPASLSGFIEN